MYLFRNEMFPAQSHLRDLFLASFKCRDHSIIPGLSYLIEISFKHFSLMNH